MEKKLLKSVLASVQVGQEINVTFRDEQKALSGNFRVLARKTGRGKGGSLLAELQALSAEDVRMTIGTPCNDKILNITVDGKNYGHANESDEPRVFATNAERALALKELMRPLLGDDGINRQVTISSKVEPAFNGTFTVNRAQLERGRYGQIHLFLTGDNGPLELWTYRHSLAVDTFEVVSE